MDFIRPAVLRKYIKNYQDNPIKGYEGNLLQTKDILCAPTANSDANPLCKPFKNLDEHEILLQYDDVLSEEIKQILKMMKNI